MLFINYYEKKYFIFLTLKFTNNFFLILKCKEPRINLFFQKPQTNFKFKR